MIILPNLTHSEQDICRKKININENANLLVKLFLEFHVSFFFLL